MGAGGNTAARPGMASGPLSFAIEADALEAWLAGAEVGDKIVYAKGPALPWSAEVVVLARNLSDEGLVRTHLRKVGGNFEYLAVKRAPETMPVPATRPTVARGDSDIDARILRELCRAANAKAVCPSNAELAKLCGLSRPDDASYRVRKLVQSGTIRSEERGPNKRRIVTIVATGQRTVPGAL